MGFKIAEAFVEVTADGSKVAKKLASDIGGSDAGTKAGTGFGKKLIGGLIATGIGVAVGSYLKSAIMGASDMNETLSKSTKIFGKQAAEITKWSKTSAKTLGLSQEAALSAAASFGDMFSQIGFTGKASAKMSKAVVKASADLGSFSNLDTADVADRMSAAFRGEYDSLQAVIPNINAARVESEALAATGKKLASELTAAEKATAVLAIVTKDGARAMGDFEATSDGLANQLKIAKAQSDNLKTSFGEGLLPISTAVATFFTTVLMPALLTFSENVVPKMVAGAGIIAGFFTDFSGSMDALKAKLSETDLGAQLVASFPLAAALATTIADIFTNKLWPAAQNIAGSLADASAALGVSAWDLFLASMELLVPVLDGAAEVLLSIAEFMEDQPELVAGLLAAYSGLRIGLGLTTGAQWLLNAAVSANPWVIAAGFVIGAIGTFIWAMDNLDMLTGKMLRFVLGFNVGMREIGRGFERFAAEAGVNIGKVLVWIGGLPAKIGAAIAGAVIRMNGAGRDIMAGLTSGMIGGLANALGTVRRIASDIVNAAKDALGIHSPSKVFDEEVGQQITAGLDRGALKGKAKLDHTIRNLVEVPDSARALAPSGRQGGDTYNLGDITIDASNVEDFTRIVSMVKGLGQTARAGRVQGA